MSIHKMSFYIPFHRHETTDSNCFCLTFSINNIIFFGYFWFVPSMFYTYLTYKQATSNNRYKQFLFPNNFLIPSKRSTKTFFPIEGYKRNDVVFYHRKATVLRSVYWPKLIGFAKGKSQNNNSVDTKKTTTAV